MYRKNTHIQEAEGSIRDYRMNSKAAFRGNGCWEGSIVPAALVAVTVCSTNSLVLAQRHSTCSTCCRHMWRQRHCSHTLMAQESRGGQNRCRGERARDEELRGGRNERMVRVQ